jgi:eukaryotic-like serine/threonine-protein kinase
MGIGYTVAELGFDLREVIGTGGVGKVYKSHDPQLDAELAVKEIPLAQFSNVGEFFEESRKLYLSRHHNVVPIQYACKDRNFVYIAMPYYQKRSIFDLMKKRFLTCKELVRYSLQFLSGLNNIHAKGLIHFDVKPENFLLSDSDQVLIADFGVAQFTGNYGFANVRETTKLYAPPEYFKQAAHNLKFDIYQAGLAMYRMCLGQHLFDQEVRRVADKNGSKDEETFLESLAKGKFPDTKALPLHIPKSVRKVISRSVHVDPDKRYSAVVDLLNDLSRIDDTNDWSFSTDFSTRQEWAKPGYQVMAIKSGNEWEISASKGVRRNLKYCQTGLSDVEKDKLLLECLCEPW